MASLPPSIPDRPSAEPAARTTPLAARLTAFADRIARGWRGPVLAAAIAFVAALPGLIALPPLDRDEARFAQASAQMLETGDLVDIRFQDEPRDKKPVGIHWLQALAVSLTSSVEKRDIQPYRIPSILGAMLAAAACAWGASAALGAGGGLAAGAILGSTMLLSSEGFIGKTDAVLCGATTLSMAALGRLYLAARDGPPAPRLARLWFWLGQAIALLVKGPIGPMVAALALVALWIADRKADWMRHLGWLWGLVLVLAIVGPWAVAITVATDGGFWGKAVSGDLVPKLAGGHESHGAPPGLHLLISPLIFFPAAALLPAALVHAWRKRREPFVRFALAWLVPAWLVFEAAPTKLVHYTLPLFGALAWLAAAALTGAIGPWSRRLGAVLSVMAGAAFAGLCLWAAQRYGGAGAEGWAVACAVLMLLAGTAGAAGVLRPSLAPALAAAGVFGIAAHAAMSAGLAPRLDALWVSSRAASALAAAGLDPRDGATPGPVAVAGYAEPSLVFALGTETVLGDVDDAADALEEGRPALVSRKQEPALRADLKAAGAVASQVGEVKGYNYSDGRAVDLEVWRGVPVKPDADAADAGPPAPPTGE